MKMYKVKNIVEVLTRYQGGGYCGFSFNEQGNLVVILKDYAPHWRDSKGFPEPAERIEINQNEGIYSGGKWAN